jgi:O-antigen/teichoic acid export membrane protein
VRNSRQHPAVCARGTGDWLSKIVVIVATLRFLAPIPVVIFIDDSLSTYFSLQVCVAAAELIILYIKSKQLIKDSAPQVAECDINIPLRPIFKFMSGVAITSIIWVFMTQTDKLILSKILPLEEFGQFSMAVLLANGINMISGPISLALLPRLTSVAQTDERELIYLYEKFTQITVALLVAIGGSLCVFSYEVMYGWTGDQQLARQAGIVMGLPGWMYSNLMPHS